MLTLPYVLWLAAVYCTPEVEGEPHLRLQLIDCFCALRSVCVYFIFAYILAPWRCRTTLHLNTVSTLAEFYSREIKISLPLDLERARCVFLESFGWVCAVWIRNFALYHTPNGDVVSMYKRCQRGDANTPSYDDAPRTGSRLIRKCSRIVKLGIDIGTTARFFFDQKEAFYYIFCEVLLNVT